MPEIFYSDEHVTLWHGDCLDVLADLPAASVDAVITDPPYNVSSRSGRDGTTPSTLRRKDGTHRKLQRDFGDWDREWNPAPFLAHTARLLRPGGSLVAFTSEFTLPAYLDSELNHRNVIYWRKTNPTPAFRKLYVRAVEMAVFQVNGTTGWTWNGGGYVPNVYEGPTVTGFTVANGESRYHPTQKPLWLMSALTAQHTIDGEVVLDPFAGSGTTLVAAKQAGRKAIGVELDERYCEAAARRLSQGVLDFGKDAS
mgnify:FL=1